MAKLGFLKRMAYCACIILFSIQHSLVHAASSDAGHSTSGSPSDLLAKKLAEFTSFKADFVQFIVDKSGSTIQQTSGELRAKRPGLFYWYTAPPLEQYVKSDGKEVWIYDPDLEQVTVHQTQENLNNTPALLLSGDVIKLEENYTITLNKTDAIESYTLVPKAEASLFESLKLRFIDDVLVEMRLMDGLGQKSTLSFTNTQVNPPLTDKDFTIEYPDDVDLIKE